jgi:hypothetical protein
MSSQSKISPHCDENPDNKGGKAAMVTPKKATRKSCRGSSSSSSSSSSAPQLDVGTPLTDAALVANAAKAADALRSQERKDPEKLKEENDIIFGTSTAEASLFDRFHDISKRRRLMKVFVSILLTDTVEGHKPFAAHLSGATIELRKTLNLANIYKMSWRNIWDMPRKLDKNGKLVPMWSFATSGWWLLKGDVTNIDDVTSSFRRHVDQGVFNEELEFEYVDTYVTRDIAISLVEAIRQRKGVECNVDVTGL